jgi:uncharacterized protein YtpQ (UPF0354 family)
MGDLESRYEKCERDIQQLRVEFDTLRSEMTEAVGGMLTRVDEILAKVETYNEQMFADLQARTDTGFARLRACIDAASRTERKDDEPPKLN